MLNLIQKYNTAVGFSIIVLCAMLVNIQLSYSAQPENVGQGKNKVKNDHASSNKNNKKNNASGSYSIFTEVDRDFVFRFYKTEFSSGHCPPGLAKKNNGCQPPGQVKKWKYGQPLPTDVIYYDLPVTILEQLGQAPDNHKFVRVAADLLLIAIGTGIVVDAIEDLAEVL